MANYRAVANGNWSNLATWQDNGGGSFAASSVLPGVNDDVYANGFAVTIDINISVKSLRNHVTTGVSNNGGFTASANGLIITVSDYIGGNATSSGTSTLTTNISVSHSLSIVTNIIQSGDVNASGINCIGAGTTNITCVSSTGGNAATGRGVSNSGTGTVFFTGNPLGGMSGAGVGNVSTGTVNVTGVPLGYTGASVGAAGVINSSTGAVYITGGATAGSKQPGVSSTTNGYIKITGPQTATEQPAVVSSGTTAINIFTGPFISGPTGIVAFQCFRVHYEITTGSYYEFRDSSTNGAGTAPATQLVAPGTAVDSPDEADVRQGVDYAFSTLTGTLIVPDPSDVRKSVPTDDTVGTAELTAQDIFDAIAASSDPIATRLRNVATVATTGDQIAAVVA